MVQSLTVGKNAEKTTEWGMQTFANITLKRLSEPEDVAAAVSFRLLDQIQTTLQVKPLSSMVSTLIPLR